VLILNCARVALNKLVSAAACRLAARVGAAVGLSVTTMLTIWSAAHAAGIATGGCVGAGASVNCVVRWGEASDPYIRLVPAPADEAEKAQSADRDHKWEQRCRPVIAQDQYGVPRYRYSAPGCEFGVIQ
jgi:hypothetical protein